MNVIRFPLRSSFVATLQVAFLFAVTCCDALAAETAGNSQPIQSPLPNIVFILVDDMGYGDPGCYNPRSKIRTPHIDRVAAEGMRFTDAHASGPLCHLSRYGLMTGRYPFRASPGKWRNEPTIAEDRLTVAGMLRTQGYRTAMVGKWHLGFKENGYERPLPGGPVDRGFDSFFGIRASTDIPPYFYIRDRKAVEPPSVPIAARTTPGWTPIQGEFWRAGLISPDMQLKDVLPRFTEEAVEVIEGHDSNGAKPLFLYLAYPAPHTPWLPSPEFAGKSQVPLYGDFTEMVDAMIGRVLSALDAAKMQENTLVIISSDNGPVWYDADVDKYGHDSSGPLRGMKSDAWEAGHRMPFVVRWPGRVQPGSVSDRLVCFTDVFATLATLTGYRLTDNDAPDSFDFAPLLQPSARAQTDVRRELVMESGSGHMTLRQDSWKFINSLGSGGFSKPRKRTPNPGEAEFQLYNLQTDLSEQENVAGDEPTRVASMKVRIKAVERSAGHRFN